MGGLQQSKAETCGFGGEDEGIGIPGGFEGLPGAFGEAWKEEEGFRAQKG